MAQVSVTKSINAPADKVWAKLASFRGIEEFSPIERSVTNGEGAGATRSCFMPDGAEIKEILNSVDNDSMQFEYAITEGPFPITNYVSNVQVKKDGEGAEVTWACTYEPASAEAQEEMDKLFDGFYNVMIDTLGTIL